VVVRAVDKAHGGTKPQASNAGSRYG
jgi:hypothetical protein